MERICSCTLNIRKPAIPWFTATHAAYILENKNDTSKLAKSSWAKTHAHTNRNNTNIATNKRHNDMYQPVTRLTTQFNQNWILNYVQFIKVNDFYQSAFIFISLLALYRCIIHKKDTSTMIPYAKRTNKNNQNRLCQAITRISSRI